MICLNRRSFRWLLVLPAIAAAFFIVRQVSACGPFLTTALFGDIGQPDTPMKDFANGKLGIVRPTLSKENLVIAYRHMEGWGLDEEAQKSVLEAPERDQGGPGPEPDLWLKTRAQVIPGEGPKIDPFTQLKEYNSYVRIPAGAFQHATTKLEELVKAHGAKSPDLVEWVKAQDQVFSTTAAAPAIPQAVKGPDWLRAERNYQIAAALFYAEKFNEARNAFFAISLDKTSPWQPWGAYLQARCWVREATLKGLQVDPKSEPPDRLRPYQQAQALLETLLKTKNLPPDLQDALDNYRDLVRHRTEPAHLRDEALMELAMAKPGASFRPAMAKLLSAEKFLKKGKEAPKGILSPRAAGLRAWLDAFQAEGGATPESVLVKDAKVSTSMLVAALTQLPKTHPDARSLMALARKVPATSPAYATVQWRLFWLELGTFPPAAANAKLEAALQQKEQPSWALNSLRKERRSRAKSLEEWVPFAPSFVVATETENEVEPSKPDAKTGTLPQLFSGLEGNVINQSLTLDQLLSVAKSSSLPKAMADEVARCAWLRAVLLERMDKAAALTPLLESNLRERAVKIVKLQDAVERRFEAVRLMLENPGLRFEIGTDYATRVNGTDVKEFDSLRDNWWCGPREDSPKKKLEAGPNPGFLPSSGIQEAFADRAALEKIPAAQIYFANTVMAFAEAHPDDIRVPEALHKVVGTTRSPMCGSAEMTAMSKRCFNLLHKQYPKSEWTRKTKYYY